MQETIKQYLEFRKRFTKREWFELNKNIEAQFAKKADQLKLDDSDIQIISERLKKFI
ncbi:hypothetical protein [Streptococcus dysgalactiae]|uniref:hypothetical protein n=1 Tax=Streptococcus dysgalactiae TaxID=1334 RepID=UPI002E98453A|nr:hypothetical protein [Streptococcus dysgalactiae]